MTKSDADVIKEFHKLVNMSADELEKWLKSKDSTSSGWTNGEGGETVGHQSGNKIVDILRRNPQKKEDKYTQDDLKHMRKVCSYNKRHLAQEAHLKDKKSKQELKQTKSYKSLKSSASNESSSSTFRSDVALPTALNTGRIGAAQTMASTAAASASNQSRLSSSEYLDQLEENVNKSIDAEVDTLLESYKELVSLASIADKDKFRVAQEAFQAEARADIMVRSVQSLSLLSDSLKMTLLLSKSPDPALNDEAFELMKNTELEKIACAHLLEKLLGLDPPQAQSMVEQVDRQNLASADIPSDPNVSESMKPSPSHQSQKGTDAESSDFEADDTGDFDMEDVSGG